MCSSTITNRITQVLHVKFTHSLFFPTKLQLQTKQQIFGNRELLAIDLSELTTVNNIFTVRDNPSSNGFIVVTRTTTAPKLTVRYHLSIQTKQQQIIQTQKLEQLSVPQLRTTNSLEVRDIPCLFHSFPQQIDSSFHRDHNNKSTTPNLQYLPPIHLSIQTKTTTDRQQREPRRHLPTCADDIEFFFSGTQRVTTSRHRRRPHLYLFCFSDVYYLPLSSFPTQQIHSSSQQHQTHVPPSIPLFPLTTYPSFQSYRFSATAIFRHSAHPTL